MPWPAEFKPLTAAQLPQAISGSRIVAVHVWAPWNVHDLKLQPLLGEIVERFGSTTDFYTVNTDEEASLELTTTWRITNVPAFVIYRGMTHVATFYMRGATVEEYRDRVNDYLASMTEEAPIKPRASSTAVAALAAQRNEQPGSTVQAPPTRVVPPVDNRRHRGLRLALFGVFLQIASPFVGFFGSVLLFSRAFAARTEDAGASQQRIETAVRLMLNLVGFEFVGGLVGWALVLLAVVVLRARTQSLFYWLVVGCISQLIFLPFGTLLSVCMLLYLARRHHEFVEPDNFRTKLLRTV